MQQKIFMVPLKVPLKNNKPTKKIVNKLLIVPLIGQNEPEIEKICTVFSHTEKSINCINNTNKFQLRLIDSKFEIHSNGITDKSDIQYMNIILGYIKKELKIPKTHEEICNVLNTLCGTATSLRIIVNRIYPKPPVERKPPPVWREKIKELKNNLSDKDICTTINKMRLSMDDYKLAVQYYKNNILLKNLR